MANFYQIFVYCQLCWKDENKGKRGRENPFKKDPLLDKLIFKSRLVGNAKEVKKYPKHFPIFAFITAAFKNIFQDVKPLVSSKQYDQMIKLKVAQKLTQKVATTVFTLEWFLSKKHKKSPNIWATFVRIFVPRTFKNCPIWSHCRHKLHFGKNKLLLKIDFQSKKATLKRNKCKHVYWLKHNKPCWA